MNKTLNVAAIMLLLAGVVSCQSESETDQSVTALKGTKWKLVGIVDETGSLKELDIGPILGFEKNYPKRYTLVFDTDSSFLAFSSNNEFEGGYIADYETYSFQVTYFGGSKAGEVGDGELYSDLFWKEDIQSFSLQRNVLILYYNDNKNYLLFKSQQL